MRRLAVLGAVVICLLAALPTSGATWTAATGATGTVGTRQPIRVTTYEIGAGGFVGNDYTLTLLQSLAPNYFVMIRGSAGSGQLTSRPSTDSVRVVRDPYRLGSPTSANQLVLHRETTTTTNNAQSDWRGTITVVESPDSPTTDGFRLVDALEITLTSTTLTASKSVAGSFNASRTVPFGGIRGGGVVTTANAAGEYRSQWARFYLTGTTQVSAEGSGIPNGDTAIYTIYVVEWGSRWSVQHVFATGSQGGNGLNTTGEYTQVSLPASVQRARTWLVAFGNSTGSSLGSGWQGNVFTLGDGVSTNAQESQVAVGSEAGATRRVDLYTLTHPNLTVTQIFGPDGTIGSNDDAGTIAVPAPLGPETRTSGTLSTTSGTRLSMFTNGSNGGGTAYPRPIIWARHEASTSITWERARSGQPGVFWVQSVDFGAVWR